MAAIFTVPYGLLPNAASALLLVSSRGVAIDFDSRRAAIRIGQQRIAPINCDQALGPGHAGLLSAGSSSSSS